MAKYLIIPDQNAVEESLSLAKDYNCGFEFNDFFSPVILDAKEQKEELISFYQSLKLPEIRTLHGDFFDVTIFSSDEKIAAISEERIYQSLEVAKQLKCRGVVFHGNINPFLTAKIYRDNWLSKNAAFFRKVCGEFPEMNLYMENMFDRCPDDLCKLAEALKDVPNFGICFDYAHAFISGLEMIKWCESLGPYIKHVHINDNDGVQDLHLAVGDGIIDWEEFIHFQKLYFPDATVLIETTGTEKQRRSIQYMRKKQFPGMG